MFRIPSTGSPVNVEFPETFQQFGTILLVVTCVRDGVGHHVFSILSAVNEVILQWHWFIKTNFRHLDKQKTDCDYSYCDQHCTF
jgi:hypothetical protein